MPLTIKVVIERIANYGERHHMFHPGARVGVAVSGGADSVFLLHALHELASRWNLRLSVLHVEHGIRGAASIEDAEFVRQLAINFGLPFHLHSADVPSIDDNLEQAARRVRQGFFAELISNGALDRVATGHTRNDQAETVLYRILRGSGLSGLAGILPVTQKGNVRPLLEITRAEIEAWLSQHGITWREDATNNDRSYVRNWLRFDILPRLRETLNPQLDDALANLATLARDEEQYWEAQVADIVDVGPQVLKVGDLASAPPALARRRIRKAISLVKGDLRQIEFAHVERILEMACSREGHDRVQLPGLDVFRSFDWIRISPVKAGPPPDRDFSFPVSAPGSVELPRSLTRITLQVKEKTEQPTGRGTVVDELDWQRFALTAGALPGLELRNWRPGDQYRRVGQPKQEKIKFLFQEARIPLWERKDWPIITYNGTIVWVRRFGAAAEFAAGPESRIVLRIQESGAESGYRSAAR